jgi:thioredoxin reductase (NADPH)
VELATEADVFPRLSIGEMALVRDRAERRACADGEVIFKAGDADIPFYVVESGELEIVNPSDSDTRITAHRPGEFAGDIDLLTRRPVIVTAIARGPNTVLLKVKGDDLRHLLGTVPKLGEKLINAFSLRREKLSQSDVYGLKVIGGGTDAGAMEIKEFLQRNFVPYTWFDAAKDKGRAALDAVNKRLDETPVVVCGDGSVLTKPTLRQVAKCAGVQRACPDEVFDVAIVGAGPAGMTAAVYAASEALKTVVLDRLGPGGQAGGSSLIENFIGFPSGLSGTELATRGVLQMLKFGALLVAPAAVQKIDAPRDPKQPLTLHTDDAGVIHAKSLLIATGATWRKLSADNADRFERAGIFYAATSVESRVCTGKDAVVIGGGNSAGQAAMFLSECSKRVHMLIRGPRLEEGMSDYLVARIRSCDRIAVHENTEVTKVLGDKQLEGVEIIDSESSGRSVIECAAVYVFIGAEPNTRWLPDAIRRDDRGYVLVGNEAQRSGAWPLDREPCPLETTLPRVLAAGDVRCGSTKRVGFAVGDGSLAVTCVHRLRNLA